MQELPSKSRRKRKGVYSILLRPIKHDSLKHADFGRAALGILEFKTDGEGDGGQKETQEGKRGCTLGSC